MRILANSLLVLAAVVWAGTAAAGTVDATVTNDGHVDSETVYDISDAISVDVTIDTEVAINTYGIHVQWSDNLEVEVDSITAIDNPHPGSDLCIPSVGCFPGQNWKSLGGSGTIDEDGVYFNSTDLGDEGGVFVDELVGQHPTEGHRGSVKPPPVRRQDHGVTFTQEGADAGGERERAGGRAVAVEEQHRGRPRTQ